jgi:hypothetical protein
MKIPLEMGVTNRLECPEYISVQARLPQFSVDDQGALSDESTPDVELWLLL